jgi:hypothetical protein
MQVNPASENGATSFGAKTVGSLIKFLTLVLSNSA